MLRGWLQTEVNPDPHQQLQQLKNSACRIKIPYHLTDDARCSRPSVI